MTNMCHVYVSETAIFVEGGSQSAIDMRFLSLGGNPIIPAVTHYDT